jgi:hypothetical protein
MAIDSATAPKAYDTLLGIDANQDDGMRAPAAEESRPGDH